MKFKERLKEVIQSVLRHEYICGTRPYLFQYSSFRFKENQIDGKGLKNSNCIIENLSFIKIFYTMKEVMGDILYHTTKITKGLSRILKSSLLRLLQLFLRKQGCKDQKLIQSSTNTNGKVPNSQLGTTNESQEVSTFPAGDHKAQINRRAQRHNKHKTEKA